MTVADDIATFDLTDPFVAAADPDSMLAWLQSDTRNPQSGVPHRPLDFIGKT